MNITNKLIMILLKLQDSERIEALHPQFKRLFDFLKSTDLKSLPFGRIELDGDNMFINVDHPVLKKKEEQILEAHRAYVDVHVPIDGDEVIGWRAISDIDIPSNDPFDEKRDIAFYDAPSSTYVEVHPGEFLIAYPEDAHAPIIGNGQIKKIIAKIKL